MNPRIGPAQIIFVGIFIYELIGWPLAQIFELPTYSYVCAKINKPNPSHYEQFAYGITIYAIAMMAIVYGVSSINSLTQAYCLRPVVHDSVATRRLWASTIALILAGCAIQFFQAGMVIPLLESASLTHEEYNVYRGAISESVNQSLFNIIIELLCPLAIVVAALAERKKRWIVVSLAAWILSCSFSLSRSSIGISILTILFAWSLISRPRIGQVLMMAMIPILMTLAVMANSLKEQEVFRASFERVVVGQWVGLPLYLSRFESDPQPLISIAHPLIRNALSDGQMETPGRRLMLEMEPQSAALGAAGNIPTFFPGEAFAVAGIIGVIVSPFVVMTHWWFVAWLFLRFPKNDYFTILYAWILMKIFLGTLLGISTFFCSGLQLLILGLFFVLLLTGRKLTRCHQLPGAVVEKP